MSADREVARRALALALRDKHLAERKVDQAAAAFRGLAPDGHISLCDYCNAPLAGSEAYEHDNRGVRMRGCRPPAGPCFKAMMKEVGG